MTVRNIGNMLKEILSDYEIEWSTPEENRVDGDIVPELLLPVIDILNSIDGIYLAAITGLDNGETAPTLSVLYHFCLGADVVTLRILISKEAPDINSICSILPYASPLERETREMFGVNFIDTPDTSLLFLPDEQDIQLYPLRKDRLASGVHDED